MGSKAVKQPNKLIIWWYSENRFIGSNFKKKTPINHILIISSTQREMSLFDPQQSSYNFWYTQLAQMRNWVI